MTRETPDGTASQPQIDNELDALFRLDREDTGELLLVRHAEPASGTATDPDAVAIDPMLSCEGLRQAERLADRLSGLWIDAVYSAPERRCFQTAKVTADLLQRPLHVVEGLADIDFDPHEAVGSPGAYAERFCHDPRWESLPGFAPGQAFRRRAAMAIDGIIARHLARRCVVITHASIINAYVSMLLRIPRDLFFAPDHTSLSVIRHRRDLYALRTLNDTSHLSLGISSWGLPPAFTPRSLPLTNR
ncbi:MAG TPA: histidine phosphatase family protein [Dehalococcoidia bacterium]|nr:histidine phosphatase family protein [Dehalococcoidia bacterium]